MHFRAQNWGPIYPFTQKKTFLGNFIYLIFFYSLLLIMLQSLKKILRADSNILSYAIFCPKLGPNLAICPTQEFFGKFHSSNFFLLLTSHYGAKFVKNPQSRLQHINFRPKIGTKFTHLPQTRIFFKISFMSFFSTHYLSF